MSKQIRWGIYAWVHIPTDRTYVGQTGPTKGFSNRRNNHLTDLRRGVHPSRHFQNAWNKYGEAEFEWVVLEDMTGGDPETLTQREQWWMDNTKCAFNSSLVAGSLRNYRHTPETRAKIRAAKASASAETRAKISRTLREYYDKHPERRAVISEEQRSRWDDPQYRARQVELRLGRASWNKGVPHKPESNAKNSEAHKGKIPWNKGKKTGPRSDETKAKIGAAHRGRHREPHTAESRSKMSEAAKNRAPASDETRAKISEALRSRWAIRKSGTPKERR